MMDRSSPEYKQIEDLYAQWYTPLYRFVYARVSRQTDAEDITQTVFMKLCDHLKGNTNNISPAFFWTMARNTLIDHYRRKSTHDIVNDEIILEHESTSFEEGLIENKELIQEALRHLTEEERELISLRYWNDLSMEDIAKIENKTPEAIRKTLSRVIQKLRIQLKNI